MARATDGGLSIEFLGRTVDPDDPYRPVISSTVKTTSRILVLAIRRRDINSSLYCRINVYTSDYNGRRWNFVSSAVETDFLNGNLLALIQFTDGRFLLTYGNRENRQVRARFGIDDGETWDSN